MCCVGNAPRDLAASLKLGSTQARGGIGRGPEPRASYANVWPLCQPIAPGGDSPPVRHSGRPAELRPQLEQGAHAARHGVLLNAWRRRLAAVGSARPLVRVAKTERRAHLSECAQLTYRRMPYEGVDLVKKRLPQFNTSASI